MFTTEVKRVINLIAEAVFPTDNVDENFNGHVMKLGKGDKFLTLYYDKDTERSAIFERNLIADGFKVIEYKEDKKCQELTNT